MWHQGLLGPRADRFDADARHRFVDTHFTVTHRNVIPGRFLIVPAVTPAG